jgi:hypothetical protein
LRADRVAAGDDLGPARGRRSWPDADLIQIKSDGPTDEVRLMCSCGCDLWIELASVAARSAWAQSDAAGITRETRCGDVAGPTAHATIGAPEPGLFLKVMAKCFDWLAGPETTNITKARS